MERSLLLDLEENRKRLKYYSELKKKVGPNPPQTIVKWIEIYTERSAQLERQMKTAVSAKSSKTH